ncbi:MAG: hypothetical protein JNK87_42930 [Bryobacterales bacterium]|nr:hypothetical protein [Bryobacterales bacterium]
MRNQRLRTQFDEFIGGHDVTVPSEAHLEYARLTRRYLAAYRPATDEEEFLVQSLVYAHLQLRHFRRMHAEMADLKIHSSAGGQVMRYHSRYFRLRHRLHALQDKRSAQGR